MLYGGKKYVLRTQYIGACSLHRKEFATGHLLQGSGTEHVVHTTHRHIYRCLIAYIPDVEFYFRILQQMTHVILLLLVAAEDAYFLNVAVEETAQNRVTERTGTAGYQQNFVFEN